MPDENAASFASVSDSRPLVFLFRSRFFRLKASNGDTRSRAAASASARCSSAASRAGAGLEAATAGRSFFASSPAFFRSFFRSSRASWRFASNAFAAASSCVSPSSPSNPSSSSSSPAVLRRFAARAWSVFSRVATACARALIRSAMRAAKPAAPAPPFFAKPAPSRGPACAAAAATFALRPVDGSSSLSLESLESSATPPTGTGLDSRTGAAAGRIACFAGGAAAASASSSPNDNSVRSFLPWGLAAFSANRRASSSRSLSPFKSRGTMSSKGFARTSTVRNVMGSVGRSVSSVSTSPILNMLKTVLPATVPKMVCFPSNQGHASSVKKNCARFVLGEFSLAIASWPRWLKRIRAWISSLNGLPQTLSPPSPVPVGSPPCAMNPRITRWNVVPS
mmetsp:Transcript_8545/g.25531  ORF Transcript_8545/g.25531 Transcript_8545/m.25531 type:complete len:395 (+) Transcript_8545:361-1545(+)